MTHSQYVVSDKLFRLAAGWRVLLIGSRDIHPESTANCHRGPGKELRAVVGVQICLKFRKVNNVHNF